MKTELQIQKQANRREKRKQRFDGLKANVKEFLKNDSQCFGISRGMRLAVVGGCAALTINALSFLGTVINYAVNHVKLQDSIMKNSIYWIERQPNVMNWGL